MSLSLYDLFVTMGPFAKFIVVVLAVMSVITWANAVQKLVQIIRSERQTRKFAPEFSRFLQEEQLDGAIDRKSTRLNSSHGYISYAVFCLEKKKRACKGRCLVDVG